MSPANGHAQKDRAPASGPPPVSLAPAVLQVPAERVKELVAALEVPFEPSQIEWRVMNTTKNQQPVRGQVVPYADPGKPYLIRSGKGRGLYTQSVGRSIPQFHSTIPSLDLEVYEAT